MKRYYEIPAAVVAALLYLTANQLFARGPTGGAHPAMHPVFPRQQAAVRAAPWNAMASSPATRQAPPQANGFNGAAQLANVRPNISALAAQIRGRNQRLSPQQAAQAASEESNNFTRRAAVDRTDSRRNNMPSWRPWDWTDYGFRDLPGVWGDGFVGPGYVAYGIYPPYANTGDFGFGPVAAQAAIGALPHGIYPPYANSADFGFGPVAAQAEIGALPQGESQSASAPSAPAVWNNPNIARNQRSRGTDRRLTTEELTALAHAAAPRPLGGNELDPTSGALYWPGALQDDSFQPLRHEVQDHAAKWAKHGNLNRAEQNQMRERIEAMYESLKSQIDDVAPQEYVAARSFLARLLFTTTHSIF